MRKNIQIQALNSLVAFNKQGAKPKQGQTIIQDTTYYVVNDLTNAGGIQKLITPNTKRELGVTNFEGNKLNAGKFFAIDSLKISVSYSQDGQPFRESSVTHLIDYAKDLLDAELEFKQGERILFKLPVFDLIDTNRLIAAKNNMDFKELSTFPILAPNEPFEINLEHKSGAMYPTYYGVPIEVKVRVDFRGHEFRLV